MQKPIILNSLQVPKEETDGSIQTSAFLDSLRSPQCYPPPVHSMQPRQQREQHDVVGWVIKRSVKVIKNNFYLPPYRLPDNQWISLDPCQLFCWRNSKARKKVGLGQKRGLGSSVHECCQGPHPPTLLPQALPKTPKTHHHCQITCCRMGWVCW